MPERWALSEAKLLYYQRLDSPNPLTLGEAWRAIHGSVRSSIGEAPPTQTRNLWPLLSFSPGAGVNPAFYSTFTEDLASHGYAVFGIVPTGWVDTIFPNGHRVPASDRLSDDDKWFTGTALPLWAGDLRFMLDQIKRLNRDPSSVFFRRLDLNKIGAFGHSFGGAASILAGLQDHGHAGFHVQICEPSYVIEKKRVRRKVFGPQQSWDTRDGTKWEKCFNLKLTAEALSGNIVFGVADGVLRSGGLSQEDKLRRDDRIHMAIEIKES